MWLLFLPSWTYLQTLQNYNFSFCSIRLHCVRRCKHNFLGSFSGCQVIKTMYISHRWSSQIISFHKTNIYQTAYQLSQVIIPLRDAVFKFIISKLYTTDVQVLLCIYLENDKVAESHRKNTINYLNIYNIVFVSYYQSYVNRIKLKD